MPAAENGSLHPEKDIDRAPIINGMETLPKTKQVILDFPLKNIYGYVGTLNWM